MQQYKPVWSKILTGWKRKGIGLTIMIEAGVSRRAFLAVLGVSGIFKRCFSAMDRYCAFPIKPEVASSKCWWLIE
jgi:hypothetical protein